jgi:hypothetical protein
LKRCSITYPTQLSRNREDGCLAADVSARRTLLGLGCVYGLDVTKIDKDGSRPRD